MVWKTGINIVLMEWKSIVYRFVNNSGAFLFEKRVKCFCFVVVINQTKNN